MKSCIGATFFALQWELSHAEDILAGEGTPDREVAVLRSRLYDYMATMKDMVTNPENPIYQEEAYNVLCDYLVIFCERLGMCLCNGGLRPAPTFVYVLKAPLRDKLFKFLLNYNCP